MPLKETAEVKYLDILIDKHLRWSFHIYYLSNKLRKIIYKFIIRHILPINILITVYLDLFQSSVQYEIIAWGGTSKNSLKSLTLFQKRFIKICLEKPIDYPYKLIFFRI